jgi:2-polyprenyl-3-methyl-5-hydroxy-6-metoxy-1,4-benzoquinol methylase
VARSEIIQGPVSGASLPDLCSFLLAEASGKSVLNVGAAGGAAYYLPDRRSLWMHHRLGEVTGELVGVDIDAESIALAARHGIDILEANCETMSLARRFDVIIMSDVLEHLDAPGTALQRMVQHLHPHGRLFVTTPNPTYAGVVLRAVLGRGLNVYHDHVASFLPEHIQAMCDRYGFHLRAIHFFGHIDRRTSTHRLKSYAALALGRLSRRLLGSFLAIIEPKAT